MSSTSDQTTQQSKKTRLIIGEIGIDTETGIVGKGHSYDNGKTFTVDDTIYGRIYNEDDHNRIWQGIQDQVDKVVEPAKSAADSAQSAADAAIASAQVTSDAMSDIASATAEAKQGANDALSRAESAWDVATGAKEAVTDFDPLLKSAQSDASKALTQIADTASALSDAKTSFGSDVAEAKQLANTAQTTADSAVAVASDASSNATVAVQTASGASLTAINANSDATVAKQTASEAKVQASNAESDFAQLSIRAGQIEASVATNSGAIASVQQTANGLTTTVGKVDDRVKKIEDTTNWTTKTGALDMDTLTTTQNIYYRDTNLKNADGEAGWAYIQVVSTGERVTQTVWHDRSSIQHTRTGAIDGSTYDWDAWNKVATNAQVVQVKQTVDGISTTINDPKTGLNATYQTAAGNATTISNVKGDVTQLQTTANGLTSRVGSLESKTNTQQTMIDQNKAAIALKADQTTVDTLKGTVSQNTATLKTQADQIQSKVSASDVSGMLTGYATQSYTQSLVTQTADKWNLNLTRLQTDVNAIKTTGGGVNLLSGTKDFSGFTINSSSWVQDTSATSPNGQTAVYKRTGAWAGLSQPIEVQSGKTYTFSAWIKVSNYTEGKDELYFYWNSYNGNAFDDSNSGVSNVSNDTWMHIIRTATAVETGTVCPRFESKKDTMTVWVTAYMLEEGTVAHTWSPAPSDMATVTSVTNLSATVDGIKSTVATKADQSTVTELSNLIQTKVSSGDYNSQITQLKNDINLRVAKGDVISQINQEAGGDTLIQVSNGKKSLILDADNTIITGKAWIPDAAIGSISADKVMLGSSSLWNSDGTLNLLNQSNGLKALIQVKQGLVQNTTQSIISFASDYNTRAFSITPVGATVTPTLFFERYDQAPDHWLGFTRNEVQREGLEFNTWDNDGERFFVECHARFDRNISAVGTINQGTWNGTTGKPLAGILTITAGNTIWSGSDYLAIGDHLSNSFTNVMAKSFNQQSTLSSKTNIEVVDPKDALDLVNRTDILSYQYKSDVKQGKTKRYTSMIIDDVNDVSKYYAPDEFTNEERTGRDDGSAVGYLFLAIQELTRRIKNLEEKLNG